LAFFRFPHLVNVRKVTRSPRGKLRGDQILTRNETRPQIARLVNNLLKPSLPCRIKLDTGNYRENIDAERFAPYTKERPGFGKVSEGQTFKRRSELRERRENRLGVFAVRFNQNIEVFGRAGLRVDGNRVGSDNEILNAARGQSGQEFFEV
jgi:hypothetical protein